MRTLGRRIWGVCVVIICHQMTYVESVRASEKEHFTLLNPTPRHLMREMTTDRPDQTEVPFTIDAGHVQFESDLFSYTYDDEDGAITNAWAVLPTNVRIGVLNHTELGIVVEPYLHSRTREDGDTTKQQGFGTTSLRIKHNFWGNDGGQTALAVMPYISFPTSQDEVGPDKIEAGLIVPLAIEVSDRLGLGLMTEANWRRDDDQEGYHFESVFTAVLGYDITEKVGCFAEVLTAIDWENTDDPVVQFDCGVTYALTEDIQLDAGVYIGLTDAADDLTSFVGLSWRL
jgi:Putative MetA-pathway of phenol degradation